MLVTPTGRLRRPQPPLGDSSAMAGIADPAAASSAAMLSHVPGRIPSLARYIVVMPFSRGPLCSRHPPRDTLNQTRNLPASPSAHQGVLRVREGLPPEASPRREATR